MSRLLEKKQFVIHTELMNSIMLIYIIKRNPNNSLEVAFEDKCLTIKNEEDMELAYAVTVHKAQGSEWDDVTICIPEFSKFITRRMLYTALTRTIKSILQKQF